MASYVCWSNYNRLVSGSYESCFLRKSFETPVHVRLVIWLWKAVHGPHVNYYVSKPQQISLKSRTPKIQLPATFKVWIIKNKKLNLRDARIPDVCSPGQLNFVGWCLYYCQHICCSFTCPNTRYKNVYQFTCTVHKVPDNSKVHRSLHNCVLSMDLA